MYFSRWYNGYKEDPIFFVATNEFLVFFRECKKGCRFDGNSFFWERYLPTAVKWCHGVSLSVSRIIASPPFAVVVLKTSIKWKLATTQEGLKTPDRVVSKVLVDSLTSRETPSILPGRWRRNTSRRIENAHKMETRRYSGRP